MTTTDEDAQDEYTEPFVLDWQHLTFEEREERIEWLRASLTAGEDWGYCAELNVCVLKTIDATALYRLRWFTADGQSIDYSPVGSILQTDWALTNNFKI